MFIVRYNFQSLTSLASYLKRAQLAIVMLLEMLWRELPFGQFNSRTQTIGVIEPSRIVFSIKLNRVNASQANRIILF